MASLFTRIIAGELPGRFVYQDADVVAFLTIAPIKAGHTLVVPRAEINHWIDMPEDIAAKVMKASQIVGKAIQQAFNPTRVGVMVAGLEVPHVHYHLVPIHEIKDLDFSLQNDKVSAQELDEAQGKIRAALKELGYGENVPE